MGALLINWGRPSGPPLSMLSQAIPMLSRCDLEALTERLIDRLDEIDGDIDLEEDDPAGQMDEDGINTGFGSIKQMIGPGCVLSDEDCSDAGKRPHYGEDQEQPPLNYLGHFA